MQYVINGIIASALIVPVGLGFWLIFRTCGFFHFAFGAWVTLGAYVLFLFVQSRAPFLVSITAAVLLSGATALVIDRCVFAPLRRGKVSVLIPLLASLGIYVVMVNAIALYFGDQPNSVRHWPVSVGTAFFGGTITVAQKAIVLASATCVLSFWMLLGVTRFGKVVEAVACDPELARAVGIDVNRISLLSMTLGSTLAGIGGILAALDVNITPTMGMKPLIFGIVAVIVGGNTYWGTVVGALFVGMAIHLGVWKLPTQWQDAIVFVILILFLLFRPQGFFGKPLKKAAV